MSTGSFWKYLTSIRFEGNELTVDKQDVLNYCEYIYSKDIKASSKRERVGALRSFYAFAYQHDWVNKNPFSGVRLHSGSEPVRRVLSIKEVKEILNKPDLSTYGGFKAKVALELLYSCAFRISELVSLRTDSFSDDFRSVRFSGKGSKEAVLPVGKVAAHYTSFYVKEILPRVKSVGNPLFPSTHNGIPLKAKTMRQALKKYGNFHPHMFRYSIATHLSELGVDVFLIKSFLRHESLVQTSQYIKHSFQKLQTIHRQTHPRK